MRILIAFTIVQINAQAEIIFSPDNWTSINDSNMSDFDIYEMPPFQGYDRTSSMILISDSERSFTFKWKKAEDSKTYFTFYLNDMPIENYASTGWANSSKKINIGIGDKLKWEFRSQRVRSAGPASVAIPRERRPLPSPPPLPYLRPEPGGNNISNHINENLYLNGEYTGLHILDCKNLSIYGDKGDNEVIIQSDDADQILSIENSNKVRFYNFEVRKGKSTSIHIENCSECQLQNIRVHNVSKLGFYIFNSSDLILDSNNITIINSNTTAIYVEGNYTNYELINNTFEIWQNNTIIGFSQSTNSTNNSAKIFATNTIIDHGKIASVYEGEFECSIYKNNYCCNHGTDLKNSSRNITWDILGNWRCNANS